jgi:hypothetical protein
MELTLQVLEGELSIVRLAPQSGLPEWLRLAARPLVSVTLTADELSIVCPAAIVPDGLRCESGWRALRIAGAMDLSSVGVLASVLNPLAEAGIGIFAVSTFDTDYVLVRGEQFTTAVGVLGGRFRVAESSD